MSELTIESGIPVPPRNTEFRWRWPHARLNVGDSVRFTDHDEARKFYAAARVFGRKQNPARTFVMRQTSESEWRVWRIA